MGNPVAHSLSPLIHQMFAKQLGLEFAYERILIDVARFEQQVGVFFHEGGQGLNITLPCKTRAFAMSDEPSARALKAGAANTLWMEHGRLHADNTDGIGLLRDLSRHINLLGRSILLLGAGGAARGILGPLMESGLSRLTLVNRTIEKAQALQLDHANVGCCAMSELTEHVEQVVYDVVIHATSVSLHGSEIALPESLMASRPFCYDLSYQEQQQTPFLLMARHFGCKTMDGLGMLVEQAAESFFIWHGLMPQTEPVLSLLQSSRSLP